MNFNQIPIIKLSKEFTLELTDDNLIIANTLKSLFGFSIMYGKKNESGIERIISDDLLSQKTETFTFSEIKEKDDTLINLRKEVEFENTEANYGTLMFLRRELNLSVSISTGWNNETLLRNNNAK